MNNMENLLTVAHGLRDRFRGFSLPSSHNRHKLSALVVAACVGLALMNVHPMDAQVPSASPSTNYTSIVVFGDSLSDTGNDANLSAALYTVNAQVPGPATGYTNGRFTDGSDTLPAARNYTGVWVEQLAARLTSHPVILNSLAGGTNYAYGFATTDVGTSVFAYGPSNALAFTVNNMGLQLSTYLGTHPTINSNTLFVVWGGANDLINATSPTDIVNAASRDVALVQQLINAGATDFVVPNLPPLGLVPRFNGSAAISAPATGAAQGFDQALAAGLAGLAAANPGKTLHIYSLDTYTLFSTIIGPPVMSGFANVTASSQGNSAINPDTYLFWDDLHPTTYGHSLIANATYNLINGPYATTTSLTTSNAGVYLNTSITLTASVAATTGTPMGTITFMDGSTTLGSGLVTGSTSTATTSFSTSALASGTHNITAAFAGVNGFSNSSSSALAEVVTPPTFQASLSGTTVTLNRGAGTGIAVILASIGGYTGTFSVACGTQLAHFSCTPDTSSATLASGSTVRDNVTIATNVATAALDPVHSKSSNASMYALLGLPLFGILALQRSRRFGTRSLPFLAIALYASIATLGLGGCGSDPYAGDAPAGSYTVPVIVTPAGGAATTLNIAVVIQ
jgi:outer membrane lipase/esterase